MIATKTNSLFLFWVTLLALFVSLTGILAKTDQPARIFQVLFVPITVYLTLNLVSHLIKRTPALDIPAGWRRWLVYYCFVVSSTLVVVSFLATSTLPQLISSLIFSPLAIYFLILVWPRRNRAIPPPQPLAKPLSPTELDMDRRNFLKLIGTVGVAAFIYSLFSGKAQAPFFGSTPSADTVTLKDSAGNKIDPAEKSPTQGYYISEIDDSTIAYFGFVNKLGQWFIMRQDADNACRYIRGDREFSTNWTNRSLLTYDYFDNAF